MLGRIGRLPALRAGRWAVNSAAALAALSAGAAAVAVTRRLLDRPDRRDGVALVTGASRGLGLLIARELAARGYRLAICARDEAELADAEADLTGRGAEVLAVRCDVADREQVDELVRSVVDRFGRLDVVVNNAGGSPYVLTADASAKFNRKIIELNLLGPLSVSQHANAAMQTQERGGSIVNVASVSGRRPTPGTAPYGAAKAGVESLTSTLAVEWAPKVRVNSVVVGMVETEQSELFYGDEESIAAISKNVPLGRLATPADVGWAAAFLASDVASYISGASLEVHGGGEPPHYLATTNAIK
jgi:NAD(P)-dependent dehydrogenase (short-subunit alcohol dehydrogenase family)